jgi:hypothetical protein
LRHLCGPTPLPQNIFALELKLLRELGLEPDWSQARLTVGVGKIVQALLQGDWNSSSCLKLSAGQTRELGQFLQQFLLFHLGRLPRGRAAALAPAG